MIFHVPKCRCDIFVRKQVRSSGVRGDTNRSSVDTVQEDRAPVFNSKVWGGGNPVGVARVAFTAVVLGGDPRSVDIRVAELGLEASNGSAAGLETRFGETSRQLGVERLVSALAAGRYVGLAQNPQSNPCRGDALNLVPRKRYSVTARAKKSPFSPKSTKIQKRAFDRKVKKRLQTGF